MNNFKHILACLDLTDMDINIINYAAYIGKTFECNDITFLHVLQAYDLPDANDAAYEEVKSSMYNYLEKEINKHLKKEIREKLAVKIAIRVEKRDASDEIINYIRNHKISLTVFGKKAEEIRKERYSARSIALAESDMLIVPETPPLILNRIVAATDFTRHSAEAFKIAAKIAKNNNAGLSCQYIYSLPKNYFPVSSKEAMYDYIKNTARRKSKLFHKKYNKYFENTEYFLEPVDYEKQHEQIIALAESTDANLIVLGAKGRTSAPTTLLGYMTKNLRKYKSPIPIMIIKNFSEKNSFWNIFFHG
jgi:nucleotide-binding universal stress UspA family protein